MVMTPAGLLHAAPFGGGDSVNMVPGGAGESLSVTLSQLLMLQLVAGAGWGQGLVPIVELGVWLDIRSGPLFFTTIDHAIVSPTSTVEAIAVFRT